MRETMAIRFSETTLEEGPSYLRLIDGSGKLLLEVKGNEIDEAIRGGFLDPSDYHFSMYEYARIRMETSSYWENLGTRSVRNQPSQSDSDFLRSLNIAWD